MNKLETVLVGLDFSDSSLVALAEAGRLAQRDAAKLHIVHVVTADFVERYRESFTTPTDEIIEKVRAQVANSARQTLDPAVAFDVHVFIGHPFFELIRAAGELSVDLMVLGSHGRSGGSHSVGIIAAKCVRKAPVPVLLVRGAHRGAFATVVAGIDFSDTSKRALAQAAIIASRDGAALHVLHVHSPPWMWVSHCVYDLKVYPEKDFQEEYRATLNDQMAAFVAPVREEFPDLKIVTEMAEREVVAYGMRDYLKGVGADLVVIGSRGHSGLKVLLLGTTAERLIHESPCSVLTVKPEGFHYEP